MSKAKKKSSRKGKGKKESVELMVAPTSAPVKRRRKRKSGTKAISRKRYKKSTNGGAKLVSKATVIKAATAFGVGYLDAKLENNPKVPAIVKKITIPGTVFLAGVANEYFKIVKGNLGNIIKDAAISGAMIFAYKYGQKFSLTGTGAQATAVKGPSMDDYYTIEGDIDDEY